jgi:hypothetical protein
VNEVINPELPEPLRIKYVHFDMKIRKKEPGFPGTLIEYAKSFIKKVGVFFCTRSHLSEEKCDINV